MALLGPGGSVYVKPNLVTKLSQLDIDADKDWLDYGIYNVKELAAGMAKGDIVVRSDTGLIIITPGNPGSRFTTQGTGNLPIWKI